MKTPSLFPCLALLMVSLAGGNAAELASSPARHSCCSATDAPAALTDKSIYQLDASWTNDVGQTTKLGVLKGRPVVLTMFFTNCRYACPLLVYQMKRIEESLPEPVRANVAFVLVSFDPDRDTAQTLHEYRQQHELASDRWTLLRGKPADILELAALLGVRFKQDAEGQFVHSNVITVLNSDGEIVYQQIGLNSDIQPTVQAVNSRAKP